MQVKTYIALLLPLVAQLFETRILFPCSVLVAVPISAPSPWHFKSSVANGINHQGREQEESP